MPPPYTRLPESKDSEIPLSFSYTLNRSLSYIFSLQIGKNVV